MFTGGVWDPKLILVGNKAPAAGLGVQPARVNGAGRPLPDLLVPAPLGQPDVGVVEYIG